jgi:hypothetical protein
MRYHLAALLLVACSACGAAAAQSAPTGLTTAAREVHEGQIVDGVPCLRDELPIEHLHVHLEIWLDGRRMTVPAGIGVGRPWGIDNRGFILTGSCFAWIHTHDTTGVVHVFTQVGKSDMLRQVFSVWGQPLDSNGAIGVHALVAVLVNGQPFTGDPRAVPLKNLENIVIELGKPPATPPRALYDFGTMRR